MRRPYVALAVATVVLGLIIFRYGAGLGPVARDMVGDALWAAMIFWCVSALAPSARLTVRGIASAGICFAVETSQRIHAPWLDAIRSTTVGHLVLGSGFDPRDFVAYGSGVLTAMLLARLLERSARFVPIARPM